MAQHVLPVSESSSSSLVQHAKKGMQLRRTNTNSSTNTHGSTSTVSMKNRAAMIRQKHSNAQEFKTRMRAYRRTSVESEELGLHDDAEALRKSLQTLEDVMNAMSVRGGNGKETGLRRAVSLGQMAVLHQSMSNSNMSQASNGTATTGTLSTSTRSVNSNSRTNKPRRIKSAGRPTTTMLLDDLLEDSSDSTHAYANPYMDNSSKRNATWDTSASTRRGSSGTRSKTMAMLANLTGGGASSKPQSPAFPTAVVTPTRAVPRRKRSGAGTITRATNFPRSNSNRGMAAI